MSEPEVVPVNCASDTCSITLGRDPLDVETPNALIGVVNRDERTLECNDSVGMRVKVCGAADDIPYDARPIAIDGTKPNAFRVRDGATPDVADCGVLILAPLVMSIPEDIDRVTIPLVQDDATVDAAVVLLENDDDIPVLFTVSGMANIIIGFGGGAGNRMFLGDIQTYLTPNGSEFVAATGSTATTPPNTPPGAGNLRQRLTFLEHSAGAPVAPYMASAHEIRDEILVPANTTWTWHTRCRNVQHDNVVMAAPTYGYKFEGGVVRREQAWRKNI